MIKIVFKNLERSEFAKQLVDERFEAITSKFPDLKNINVTLEMENSPFQAGPDVFTVKAHCVNGRYKDLRVEKSAKTLYLALADVVEHMLELLNRYGDRSRMKSLKSKRKFDRQVQAILDSALDETTDQPDLRQRA